MQAKLKEEFLKLIKTDASFKRQIVQQVVQDIIEAEGEILTKTYLDIQLAKLAKEFDRKLEKQTKAFEEKLEAMNRKFEEKLEEQAKAFDAKLEAMSKAFDEKLEAMSRRFDEKLEAMSKEFDRKLEEQGKAFDAKLEAMSKAFDEKLEAMSRRFDEKLEAMSKEFDRKLEEQTKAFDAKLEINVKALTKSFEDRFMALGGRWGRDAEFAFREGLKDILSKDFGGKVEHWHYKGKILQVHPKREEYELDLIVSNGKITLIEVKGSVSTSDVEKFDENVSAYEIIENKKADRKVIITPLAFKEVRDLAKKFGIEIISPPIEYYYKIAENE